MLITVHRRESFGAPWERSSRPCAPWPGASRASTGSIPSKQPPRSTAGRRAARRPAEPPSPRPLRLPRAGAPARPLPVRAHRQRRHPGGGPELRQTGAGAARHHERPEGIEAASPAWWGPAASGSSPRRRSCSPPRPPTRRWRGRSTPTATATPRSASPPSSPARPGPPSGRPARRPSGARGPLRRPDAGRGAQPPHRRILRGRQRRRRGHPSGDARRAARPEAGSRLRGRLRRSGGDRGAARRPRRPPGRPAGGDRGDPRERSGTQLREDEGQRPTQLALELARRGIPVVFVYWRWSAAERCPQAQLSRRILQLPVDASGAPRPSRRRLRRPPADRPLRAFPYRSSSSPWPPERRRLDHRLRRRPRRLGGVPPGRAGHLYDEGASAIW